MNMEIDVAFITVCYVLFKVKPTNSQFHGHGDRQELYQSVLLAAGKVSIFSPVGQE